MYSPYLIQSTAKVPSISRSLWPPVAATVLLAATACSTADYSKPVNDFADATGKANTALSELNAEVTEAYRGVLEKSIVARKVFLKTETGDCEVTSERCRLVIVSSSNQKEYYPPEPPLARMTLVMAEISTYASNLKALVEADTASKVESQVNAALGSVQKLAETVASTQAGVAAQGPNIPQFATPVGEAVNWLIGQYVERVKFKGLQQATAAAKPVIHDAAELFTATSVFSSDVPKSELAEEVSQDVTAFRTAGNGINLGKLAQSAAKYDALLTSAPPQLFQRLGMAHDALAESLQGNGGTLVTAIARIEAFASEANKVAKILDDLRAIAPVKNGK